MHHEEHKQPEKKRNPFLAFYDKNYKLLTILPVIFLIICIGIIAVNFFATGEIIERDISLKGGVSIIVTPGKQVDPLAIQRSLVGKFPEREIIARGLGQSGDSIVIESDTVDEQEIQSVISELSAELGGLTKEQYSVQVIGSSLGASFYREAIFALLIAFVFMGLTVIIYFRNFVPSLLVIFAAFADIVMPFAMMVLFNIKLSTAGIAAFLMLIGYSVDTDILLTSRVLRTKEGSVLEHILSAMRTGMTMTLTALVVVLIAYFFSAADTLRHIMLILAIGLFFDIINTWFTNAGMLRWYLERKERKRDG